MGLNRSSWYYTPKLSQHKKSSRPLDQNLVSRLTHLSGYELTLGYHKVCAYLRTVYNDYFNHKKVYRHMSVLHLLQPKIIRKPKKKKLPSVLFYCPLQSNLRWESDLTLIPTEEGFLYLFTVIDAFDKEVIGSWFGFRCRRQEAPEDLSLTLRLDRGCQFTAQDFAAEARNLNISIEFRDVQAPNQKPFVESFFANFKREEVYRNIYKNTLQAFSAWPKYLDWYNNHRPHASIGYLSPAAFRHLHTKKSSLFNTLLLSENIGA